MGVDPGALARWRAHLEEAIGVDDAAHVTEPFTAVDWRELQIDVIRLKHDVSGLKDGMAELRGDVKELRRDLLRVTGAQFVMLVGTVATLVGLG